MLKRLLFNQPMYANLSAQESIAEENFILPHLIFTGTKGLRKLSAS
ncbi:hypothetical protein [Nafulsella turpanensis]|nr:hypothetical protein [Nafulsella turpanensis]